MISGKQLLEWMWQAENDPRNAQLEVRSTGRWSEDGDLIFSVQTNSGEVAEVSGKDYADALGEFLHERAIRQSEVRERHKRRLGVA
jgi:hypothetical protein